MKDHFTTPSHPYLLFGLGLGLGLRGLPASERFSRHLPSSLRERGSFLTYGPWCGPARLSVMHNYLLSLGCFYPTMLACGCQYVLELASKPYLGIPDVDRGAHSLGFVRCFPTLAPICHSCCGVAGRGSPPYSAPPRASGRAVLASCWLTATPGSGDMPTDFACPVTTC